MLCDVEKKKNTSRVCPRHIPALKLPEARRNRAGLCRKHTCRIEQPCVDLCAVARYDPERVEALVLETLRIDAKIMDIGLRVHVGQRAIARTCEWGEITVQQRPESLSLNRHTRVFG